MPRVVIVGAGLYGLIAAKTYLQVTGPNYPNNSQQSETTEDIPESFQRPRDAQSAHDDTDLLLLESGSSLGGTWAEERLYPNLLSQNSEGLYEFSDMSLSEAMEGLEDEEPPYQDTQPEDRFIPGWKLSRYLTVWSRKWNLPQYMRFNWQVKKISRLPTKEWELGIDIHPEQPSQTRSITILCDKLILSPGLTSVPNILNFAPATGQPPASAEHVIHAKEVGQWCRDNLGYQPIPGQDAHSDEASSQKTLTEPSRVPRRVAIYGGAKSSFDLVHMFATLHQKDPSFHLRGLDATGPIDPVEVHWIIRDGGSGPAWMSPPRSNMPNGQSIASDKVASTRFVGVLSPCTPLVPKRLTLRRSSNFLGWKLTVEGSWLARVLHGNPIGRYFVRRFWKALDKSWGDFAGYDSPQDGGKMGQLRPTNSVIYCGAPLGIANQRGFWDAVRAPNVHIHRSAIESVSGDTSSKEGVIITLADGTDLPLTDLLIQATGWKPTVPIEFNPPSLILQLGLSCPVPTALSSTHGDQDVKVDPEIKKLIKYWDKIDSVSTSRIRRVFGPNSRPPKDVVANTTAPTDDFEFSPYRLFRRMASPELIEEGDRSFVALGFVLTATTAVVAEVQALWAAAFLTGGLDDKRVEKCHDALSINGMSRSDIDRDISEDVVWGGLTGVGPGVDTLNYNDMLLRDLGLSPYRMGGGFVTELTSVYTPKAYRGIVEEWKSMRK
ncbi:uncharacterized protein N7515_000708 [Penicillium bovifimosum]|uniref:FAD/NAD(P)-binding domain-containing protein n=1 Tax=Penicillium bovifimosum TaxID=126998 RepID=A0A9W9HFI6_9EURO|nr:uncharacterized protein N7515_000708 [Penicillium bovifimosum]KAJ5146144.1 hypothetical protein N7515_000708 [Penicillium bovifimosum]